MKTFRSYGKEHLETVVASATTVQNGLQAIASAYGDYTKKSFEDTKSFVEKLSGVKSLDKALEVQTEFAKSAYETFVAESQKIAGLYTDLAKQTFKPLEGMVAKFTPAAAALIRRAVSEIKSPAVMAGLFLVRIGADHRDDPAIADIDVPICSEDVRGDRHRSGSQAASRSCRRAVPQSGRNAACVHRQRRLNGRLSFFVKSDRID